MRQRMVCAAFVLTTGAAYPIAAGPPDVQGTRYLLLHVALTGWMLASWAGRGADSSWVLGAGVLARVVLIGVSPFTTHDVERYVWDGAVALSGHDPYLLAPAAPALADLREHWPTSAAHVGFTTVYPPGALALFALAASAGPGSAPLVWKVLVTAASIATLLVAVLLLRRRGLERHLPLVALSPLLLLEGGVGAHLDAFSTLGLVTALWAFERHWPVAAGAALGAGGLAKFLPMLAILPLIVPLRRRAGVRLVLAAAVVTLGGYALAVACGLRPIGGLGAFFDYARFGSPLTALLEGLGGREALLLWAGGIGVAMAGAAARAARRGSWGTGVQWALAAPLVVSPVVYPWYLSPLVVCAALSPSAVVLGWVTTLPLTYEVLDALGASGQWSPASWPLAVIAAGWIVGLVVDAARLRRMP